MSPVTPSDVCVHVLGMHRSGTSALAGALQRMGFETTRGEDLMEPSESNPRGYFESVSMSSLSDRVLEALGGSWDVPPDPEPGWQRSRELDMLRAEAEEVARNALPEGMAQWKNPRTCLLLPFWREVIGRPDAVVLVWRDPLEVALSMLRADGMALHRGLALWGHYNCQALRSLSGTRVLVVAYEEVLSGGARAWADLEAFPHRLGCSGPDLTSVVSARGVLEHDLRHESGSCADSLGPLEAELLRELQPVVEVLRGAIGWHAQWEVDRLPAEGQTVSAVLDESRHAMGLSLAARAYIAGSWPVRLESECMPAVKSGRLYIQDRHDRDEFTRVLPTSRHHTPTISVVMAADYAPWPSLAQSIESVLDQTYSEWELCIACGALCSTSAREALSELTGHYSRVKKVSVSSGSAGVNLLSRALDIAAGSLVLIMGAGDQLVPGCLDKIATVFEEDPGIEIIYGDSHILLPRGEWIPRPSKPHWSPLRLLGESYIGSTIGIRAETLNRLGSFSDIPDNLEVYELLLRAGETGIQVKHVDVTLGMWRAPYGARHRTSIADDPWKYPSRRDAVVRSLGRRGADWKIQEGLSLGTFSVRPGISSDKPVTVVLCPGASPEATVAVADRLLISPGWSDFEVVVPWDAGSPGAPAVEAALSVLSGRPRHRLMAIGSPAGEETWPAAASGSAAGEVVIFLGPGLAPVSTGWMRALLEWSDVPDVGAVSGVILENALSRRVFPQADAIPSVSRGADLMPVAGEVGYVEAGAFAVRSSIVEGVYRDVTPMEGRADDPLGDQARTLASAIVASRLRCIATPLARFATIGSLR